MYENLASIARDGTSEYRVYVASGGDTSEVGYGGRDFTHRFQVQWLFGVGGRVMVQFW